MDSRKIIKLDLQTFEELSLVIDALLGFHTELIKQENREAADALLPIVKTLADLLSAIVEGNVPEIGAVFDAINEVADQVDQSLAKAKSREEIAAMILDFDEFQEMTQELLKHLTNKPKKNVCTH